MTNIAGQNAYLHFVRNVTVIFKKKWISHCFKLDSSDWLTLEGFHVIISNFSISFRDW